MFFKGIQRGVKGREMEQISIWEVDIGQSKIVGEIHAELWELTIGQLHVFVAKKIPSELEVAQPHKLLIHCSHTALHKMVFGSLRSQSGLMDGAYSLDGYNYWSTCLARRLHFKTKTYCLFQFQMSKDSSPHNKQMESSNWSIRQIDFLQRCRPAILRERNK